MNTLCMVDGDDMGVTNSINNWELAVSKTWAGVWSWRTIIHPAELLVRSRQFGLTSAQVEKWLGRKNMETRLSEIINV